MDHSVDELEAIVRDKLCHVCSDRGVDGKCGLEQRADCALFRLFPGVVQAIRSTKSDDINDYVSAIRDDVCSNCWDQSLDGSCKKRHAVKCALDAYLLLIVDAIEEITGRNFDRGALDACPSWQSAVVRP